MHTGGNLFSTSVDTLATLFESNIGINLSSGTITSACIGNSPVQLKDANDVPLAGPDRDEIVFGGTTVWVPNEAVLPIDGVRSTTTGRTIVRMHRIPGPSRVSTGIPLLTIRT